MKKLGYFVLLAVLFAPSRLLGQQKELDAVSPTPDSAAFRYSARLAQVLSEKSDQQNESLITGKHFQINGPLAQPFRTRKLRSFPRRLFHWFNPFAPVEKSEPMLRSSDYDPRPWSAVAGWNSGGPW